MMVPFDGIEVLISIGINFGRVGISGCAVSRCCNDFVHIYPVSGDNIVKQRFHFQLCSVCFISIRKVFVQVDISYFGYGSQNSG
ncbi:hypothetical protein SDC9_149791 [bioreactor metagenome]|uniref:Uncharacterized protein n=1 Tax=bioreactor metagenome TaxID=1076179 RepID=A0A645EKL4_9ZZZZ